MVDGGTAPNRIAALRARLAALVPAEYSQAALARRVGVDPDTLRSWERGRSRPRKAAARRLARALGVTVEELGLDGQRSNTLTSEGDSSKTDTPGE